MPRTKLLPVMLLTSFVHGSSHAEPQDCHDLGASHRLGLDPGQAAAAFTGPLKAVKAPTRQVPFPEGLLDSVRISLERTACEGACPSYSIELRGDGSASYTGNSFVLVNGHHSFNVSKASIQCLLMHFKQADFWSLANEYAADAYDLPKYSVALTIGGRTKTVIDYFGSAVGMPAAVTAIEEEIDNIGANRWVHGTSETLSNLQQEGFDFHSQAAATILANSATKAPDDLIMGLIEAGAPVIDQTLAHWTAVERASRAGRTAIVQALIAKGAFLNGPPDVKEDALRSAAASGNPLVVAEILKYKPNVNAQDQEGNTALINLWRSQYFGADKSKTDIVGIARLLLDAGANPNIANKNGDTALFSASNAEVVNLLIKAGGKIDTANKYGSTPLLYAESDEAAVALIEAGADTRVKSRFGDTIEKNATNKKFDKTLRLLREPNQ